MWRGSFKKTQPGTSTLIGNDHIDKIMSNNVDIWLNFDVWLICLKINLFWGGGIKAKCLLFYTCLFATNRTGMSLVTSRLRNSLKASEFSCNRASLADESATQTITSMFLTNSFQYFLHNSDPPTAKNQLYLDYSHWSFIFHFIHGEDVNVFKRNIISWFQ